MFQVLGIDVAYLHSHNAAEMTRWFQETLGLALAYEDGHWFEFQVTEGSSRLAVDAVQPPCSPVEAQPVMLSFRVDDIRAAVEALRGAGVRFYPTAEQAVFEAGPSLVATFLDPEGRWHQLSQRIN